VFASSGHTFMVTRVAVPPFIDLSTVGLQYLSGKQEWGSGLAVGVCRSLLQGPSTHTVRENTGGLTGHTMRLVG